MNRSTTTTLGALALAALVAAPAAWAQWPSNETGQRDLRAGNQRGQQPSQLGPSINVGTLDSLEIPSAPSDARERRERRNRRVARQTGIARAQPAGPEATVNEDSSSLLSENQVRKTGYNPAASQLLDTDGLINSEMSAMAEDVALGCSTYNLFDPYLFPALVGDVAVAPPDGLPPIIFATDRDDEASSASDD